MKRFRTLTLVVSLLVASSALADLDGAWTASVDEKRPGRLYISMTLGRFQNVGSTFQLTDFRGLAASQVNAAATTPVAFSLDREAGVSRFEGTFRNGKGAGQFTFTGNRAYPAAVRVLGVPFELDRHDRKRTEEEMLYVVALHDVSTAYIKSMQAIGYRTTLEKYLEMRIFDITPEYVREMESLGFGKLDADEAVETKIHGVTPQYVRNMRAAGWNLSLEDFKAFRIHKVTPEFIAELAKLGYRNLSADDLVSMRIHRVTPEFIREVEAAGYKRVPVEKLVEMKIHRIDPKMIKALNEEVD